MAPKEYRRVFFSRVWQALVKLRFRYYGYLLLQGLHVPKGSIPGLTDAINPNLGCEQEKYCNFSRLSVNYPVIQLGGAYPESGAHVDPSASASPHIW